MNKYSVELGNELGETLSNLAKELGITLTALVRLLLTPAKAEFLLHGARNIKLVIGKDTEL